MKEDNLGFFTGSLVAISISGAIMFAFYSWAYRNGYEANNCERRHGYDYKSVRPAFLAVKK